MPHKANRSFLDRKREWSKYKDLILDYYLQAHVHPASGANRCTSVCGGAELAK